MDEATFFKFDKWIDYDNSHPSSKNFPSKWARSGSRDPFINFSPSIFLECLNFASRSITESTIPKGKPRKGRGLGNVIVFGMKPRSLNFATASLLRVPHHGLKIPQKRAVYQSRGRSLNFSFFNIFGCMRWGRGEKRWGCAG